MMMPLVKAVDPLTALRIKTRVMECLALEHLSEAWNVHNRWAWWMPGLSMIERVFWVTAHGNMEIKQIYHKWMVEIDWKRILTPKIWQWFIPTSFSVSWNIYFPLIGDSAFYYKFPSETLPGFCFFVPIVFFFIFSFLSAISIFFFFFFFKSEITMVAYFENHLFSIVRTGDFWLEAQRYLYRACDWDHSPILVRV